MKVYVIQICLALAQVSYLMKQPHNSFFNAFHANIAQFEWLCNLRASVGGLRRRNELGKTAYDIDFQTCLSLFLMQNLYPD